LTAVVEPKVAATASAAPQSSGGWLIGPWFDALLIANVAWPLLLFLQLEEGFSGRDGISFWQIYFITTPHRWITLALVFLDRERFGERRLAFLGVAAVATAVCLGVRLTTGALTCLLAIDYVWNAWHFASQHHGIYRIYGRLSDPGAALSPAWLGIEKWSLRLFLLYVILRVAGGTWSWPEWDRWLARGDYLATIVPLALVAADLARFRPGGQGRSLYLASVCGLYLALLWAVHAQRPALVLSLATASALFHAIEYLSLVGWSVQKRHAAAGQRMGFLGWLAPRWAIAMGVFLLVLGVGGWLMDQRWLEVWLTVNVIVAFLHYAYDGMIWRSRSSAKAA
jgi:hypothetical protein